MPQQSQQNNSHTSSTTHNFIFVEALQKWLIADHVNVRQQASDVTQRLADFTVLDLQ